jgi:hypothetical protein
MIVILRSEGYRLTINDKIDFIENCGNAGEGRIDRPEKNVSIEQIVDWVR